MPPPSHSACQEQSGFLFSHPCTRAAAQACLQCGKPICEAHGHLVEGQLLCTTCTRQAPPQEPREGQQDERHFAGDSPYLYSAFYYDRYGYYGRDAWGDEGEFDGDDFTEADGESLRSEGFEDFEEDMGGS